MIENLRETQYDTGETANAINEELLTTNEANNYSTRRYYYPSGRATYTGNPAEDKQLFLRYPEYGLLYSWVAATNGKFTDYVPNSSEAITKSTVQGICPQGWRVPSDYDWTLLEKVIAENTTLYSDNTIVDWSASYLVSDGWRGNQHGRSMRLCTSMYGTLYAHPYAKTNYGLSHKGGFSVLLAGGVYYYPGPGIGTGIVPSEYRLHGRFFTSSKVSSTETTNYWGRSFHYDMGGVLKGKYSATTAMYSIRCKKN